VRASSTTWASTTLPSSAATVRLTSKALKARSDAPISSSSTAIRAAPPHGARRRSPVPKKRPAASSTTTRARSRAAPPVWVTSQRRNPTAARLASAVTCKFLPLLAEHLSSSSSRVPNPPSWDYTWRSCDPKQPLTPAIVDSSDRATCRRNSRRPHLP